MKLKMNYNKEVFKIGNKLLMTSCRKAIERSQKVEGTYKDVKCSFSSAKKFSSSIKKNHTKLYEKWLEQTIVYVENGESLSSRPTIDRIKNDGHYFITNIQVLSFGDNVSKAHKKA